MYHENERDWGGMACGKWYGLYNLKEGEACVGIFENTAEIRAFFGITSKNRISSGIIRGNILTFEQERYQVKVFKEATVKEVRRLMRQRFGKQWYKISEEGVFIRQPGQNWQLFASDLDEAKMLIT
jgi:hypothetical protein